MNLFLPGSGLFYLGQRKSGVILAGSFLICLLAALTIFLSGYIQYLNVVLGGDLMKEGQLEGLADVFHKRWLLVLLVAGIAIQLWSMIALSRARKKVLKPGAIPDS